jgi:fibronectin type 3 domain-containing protein
VAAAICVGPNFSTYRSGVFTTDEKASCNGGINHAILLTGWDDSTQSWILRNSWGTGWGESGYMKIRWGISNVGYAANYVVYSPANSATPTASATATSSITNTPTIGPSPTITFTPTPSTTPTQTATPTPTATAVPVANDNIDTPQQILMPSPLNFTTTLDVSNASRAYDDPIFPCTNSMGYKTVWFVYQPLFDGLLSLETTNSNYDTVLGVWSGTRGSLTSIACNDDFSYPSSVSSKISDLAVNRDQIYYVEVASYSLIGSAQLNLKVSMKIPTPSNFTASDGTSATGIVLNWDAVQGVENYKIFRATSLTGTKTLLGKVTENTYTDSNASSGDMFAYWVAACSGEVCSDYSNSDTGFRILESPTVTASLGSALDAVNLSWKSISNTVYYEIYRTESFDIDPLSTSALAVITKTRSSIPTSYKDKSVLSGKSYYYWVRACRNSICSSLDGKSVVGWKGLSKPTKLSATNNASLENVVVTWSAVSGAAKYDVYRAIGINGNKEMIGSVDLNLRFEDTSALPGVTYTYWLKACVDQNCSGFSSSTTGWRSLKAPVTLLATDGSSTSSIVLTWDIVTDASSYKLYRSTSITGRKSLINTTSNSSFVDQSAESGPIYYYWVTSCVYKNCSNYSAAESGYRLLTSPATMTASDGKNTNYIQLSWPKVKNATQYLVYRASSSDGEKTVIGSTSKTGFYDSGVTSGYIYSYWVTACNNGNCGVLYGTDTGWKGLAKLSGLTVNANNGVLSVEPGMTGANLIWPEQNGATSYIVSRSPSSRSAKVIIGLPTINSWVDSVAFSKTYYYFVQSCVENRCSPYSNAIKFTAPKGY